MSKKIILFDIDKTIFNTELMSEEINFNLNRVLKNSDLDKFLSAKTKYKKDLKNEREFVPEDFISVLSFDFNFKDPKLLLKVFYSKRYSYIYKQSVFRETLKVIDNLKNRYRLGVFSEGTAKFQNHKFNSLGLNEYFDKDLIFIVDAKDTKEVIDRLPKDVVIVDDKERICDFLFENNIDCVWLNRKDERKSDKYKTIHTLLELPDVL